MNADSIGPSLICNTLRLGRTLLLRPAGRKHSEHRCEPRLTEEFL